ncbi:MAG TPA: hypothetical protein VKA34_03730 [Balneolales bacterium]|nr:hypothetical protein [Balneolales bacterium]
MFRRLCKTILLPNSCIFTTSKSSNPEKHSGCCGFEVTQPLVLNKIPGFAKPSFILI